MNNYLKKIHLAKKIRKIFELYKDEIELPFFYSFPKNCCEGASHFLAFILMQDFPASTVEVVHGRNENGEHHFWVEMDGLIFDITIDQFPEYSSPIYNLSGDNLITLFHEAARCTASIAMLELNFIEHHRKNAVLSFINEKLRVM